MRTYITFGLIDSKTVELSNGNRIAYVPIHLAQTLAHYMIKAGYKVEYGLTGFVTLYQEI